VACLSRTRPLLYWSARRETFPEIRACSRIGVTLRHGGMVAWSDRYQLHSGPLRGARVGSMNDEIEIIGRLHLRQLLDSLLVAVMERGAALTLALNGNSREGPFSIVCGSPQGIVDGEAS